MIGKSWIREQDPQDPFLFEALREADWDDVPLRIMGFRRGNREDALIEMAR